MNYFICFLNKKARERIKPKEGKEKKKEKPNMKSANNKNVDEEYRKTLEVETYG